MFSRLRRLISGPPKKKRRHTACKQSVENRSSANPTEEELSEFEKPYAGPQTGELVERYSGESWLDLVVAAY